MRASRFQAVVLSALAWSTPAAVLRAQLPRGAPPAMVWVRVADSSRVPVPDATVALVRNDSTLVLLTRTDSTGTARFEFAPDSSTFTLAVRRIGYAPASQAIRARRGDSLSLAITVARLAAALDTVRVAERALPLDRRPHLDSTEIAASSRSILSLGDALLKLRGDIGYATSKCMSAPVLGHIAFGPLPRNNVVRMHLGKLPGADVYVNGELYRLNYDPWYSIAAEAIADIRFVNCYDHSIPGVAPSPWPHIFVTLKPGYDWDYDRGAFKVTAADTSRKP